VVGPSVCSRQKLTPVNFSSSTSGMPGRQTITERHGDKQRWETQILLNTQRRKLRWLDDGEACRSSRVGVTCQCGVVASRWR
jgi:hypothetical protein